MKQYIMNWNNEGWYILCENYKDEKDKTKVYLFFPKGTLEPMYEPNSKGFCLKRIDIQEAKFTSYKKKAGMTIFKYEELSELPVTEDNTKGDDTYYRQVDLNDGEKNMFGNKNYIESDDLPFY